MKKLLQVSDYQTWLGGIETYVINTSKLLEKNWFQVEGLGLHWPLAILKKVKGFLLPLSGFNIIAAIQLIQKCISFRPDVVWFHSLIRYQGWLPVWVSCLFPSQKLMIYHDLWYFHPYPSLLTQEEQILPWSYRNWMKMGKEQEARNMKRGIIEYVTSFILVNLKFVSMSLLRLTLLKIIDKHIVPSEFMVKYLIDRWVSPKKIEVLPHFIPEI